MKVFGGIRVGALVCMAAIAISAVAEAQPPEGGRQRGGQPGQRGGQRGDRGFGGGPPGGGFGGGRGFRLPSVDRATLLGADAVRDELKIDEGQGATIDAALQAFREERDSSRPDFSAFREMSDEERRAAFEKMNAEREARSKKADEVLAALLLGDQLKRLDQIAFQVNLRGGLVRGLLGDDLKAKLKITDEQAEKLQSLDEANSEKR